MKKITILVIIILIIFNFISPYINVVYADPPVSSSTTNTTNTVTNKVNKPQSSEDGVIMSMDRYKKLDEGKAIIDGSETTIKVADSDVGSFGSWFASAISTAAAVFSKMITKATRDGGYVYAESEYSAEETGLFTINSLVFGEYFMFNSKAYEKSTDIIPDTTGATEKSEILKTIDKIKDMGASLGMLVVRFGIAISLPLVLYSIAHVAIAKTSTDLAAWKKILVRWFLCLFLLFFFQYILATIDKASEVCTDTLWKMRVNLEESGCESFEITVEKSIIDALINTGGVTSLAYAIEFLAIVILQIIFLAKYVGRTFGLFFLFIKAPIVIVKHSVSLMLGKESDTLGEFFKTYMILSFMLPFHAMLYFIFLISMSEIAIQVPIIGIFLLYALLRAGSVAKAMLGFELGSSILS